MKLQGLKTCLLPKPPTKNHKQLFQLKKKDMILSIQEEEISFNELMLVLAKYNVKFYSPNQFKKICKLFSNSYQAIPKAIPFSYMQLHHTYQERHQDYYLVDISSKKVQLFVNDGVEIPQHGIEQCLKDFIIIMKKRYGKQINWFKVIGGMTVSVTIQVETFKENLKEILKNSRHVKCIQKLTEHFLQPQEKHIFWHKFMSIIKKQIRLLQEDLKERNGVKTIQNMQFQNKIQNNKQRCKTQTRILNNFQRGLTRVVPQKRSSSSVIQTKTLNSFYQNHNKKRKEDLFEAKERSNTQPKQKLNDFIVMKKCSLHSKLSQQKSIYEKQLLEFRHTTKTSAFLSQQVDPEGNSNKRQAFFWNYLRKKRKRQIQ